MLQAIAGDAASEGARSGADRDALLLLPHCSVTNDIVDDGLAVNAPPLTDTN